MPVITAPQIPAHVDQATNLDDRQVDNRSRHVSDGIGQKLTGIQPDVTSHFKTVFVNDTSDSVLQTPVIQDNCTIPAEKIVDKETRDFARGSPQIQDNFTYPFKTVFDKELRDVAEDTPQIQDIVVEQNIAFDWSVVIRIDYPSGLSACQKIKLQESVQGQLQSEWYINYVENNMYFCIPEDCHIPWPGYVIGELIVGFLPLIVFASGITATSIRLNWMPTSDIGGRQYYVFLNPNDIYNSINLPGTVSSYDVTNLVPGHTYRFQVFMVDVNGNYADSRILVVSTLPSS